MTEKIEGLNVSLQQNNVVEVLEEFVEFRAQVHFRKALKQANTIAGLYLYDVEDIRAGWARTTIRREVGEMIQRRFREKVDEYVKSQKIDPSHKREAESNRIKGLDANLPSE